MEEIGTDTLRELAPCWSLAGDERLLKILQNTHQRLLARCQEANSRLEQMATTLEDASIHLQNVNNQFMALSSSQFIESRVYEDDADSAMSTAAINEVPKPSPLDQLSMLKRSVAVIESTHEVITIVDDSDTSDTDDDVPDRQVMKAKDMYADRPLPYIIGSENWKNKWHAGLVVEDSDSESCTSKVGKDSDQYSQSEPEDFTPAPVSAVRDTIPVAHVRNFSESSSELPSEATPVIKTPADVASELARRLGSGHLPPKVVEPEYDEPTKPTVRKIYKPQEPITSTIFPDEPPPLDEQTDSDTDIFADLHRQQPYHQPHARRDVTEELFGRSEEHDGGDIFSDFAQSSTATKPTSLFDAGPKPHMFEKQHIATQQPQGHPKVVEQSPRSQDTDDKSVVKKPVGGISLFGSNKGAESIGTAILKRNQRKSFSSDDGSGNDTLSGSPPRKQQSKTEKDIFEDLFAKNKNKRITLKVDNVVKDIKQIQRKTEENIKKDTPKPVDLFSDNLFDDIDDIFTTNVVKTVDDTKNKRVIFEDDDDLFTEIANPKTEKRDKSNSETKTSLFDSDDDLFSEKPSVSRRLENPLKSGVESTKTIEASRPTRLLDDTEEPLFGNVKINNVSETHNVAKANAHLTKPVEDSKNKFNSPLLFDDDDDASDLFRESIESTNVTKQKLSVGRNTDSSYKPKNKIAEKSALSAAGSNLVFKEIQTEFVSKAADVRSDKLDQNKSSLMNTGENTDMYNKNDSKFPGQVPPSSIISNNKIINDIPNENSNCDSEQGFKETINTSISINNNTSDNSKISDDDYSKQDFGDESAPERKLTEVNNSRISSDLKINAMPTKHTHIGSSKINVHSITTSSLDEDIISSPKEIPDLTKTEDDNNFNKSSDPDIFNDILTEPPVFEKPKEPKKNKNVNALFDDDSDDETLFFKKDDVIFDDNPGEFNTAQDRLYNIFTTVPPEIDFKKIGDNLDDDLFSAPIKPNTPSKKLVDTRNVDEVLFDGIPPMGTESKSISPSVTTELKFESGSEITTLENKEKIGDIFKLLNSDAPEKTLFNKESGSVLNDDDDIYKQPTELNSSLKKQEQASNASKNRDVLPDAVLPGKTLPSKETSGILNDDILPVKLLSSEETYSKKEDNNESIFKQTIHSMSNTAESHEYLSDDDEALFKSLPVQLSKSIPSSETSDRQFSYKSDDEEFQSLPNLNTLENTATSRPTDSSNQENLLAEPEMSEKKVGKLKVGLNINVKALLPGASPKKVKTSDNIDGESQSKEFIQKDDSKLNQAIVFEGESESKILDNKLSKERPRIQVKRRPSTRKARKEAVRKSAIHFGEDSTDYSSSFDDPFKVTVAIHAETAKDAEVININTEIEKTDNENIVKKTTDKHPSTVNDDMESTEFNYKPLNEPKQAEIQIENVNPQAVNQNIMQPTKSNSTTKIVYILNDEDIFNTSAIETTDIKNDSATSLSEQSPKNKEHSCSTSAEDTNNISEIVDINNLNSSVAKNLGNGLIQNTDDLTSNIEKDTKITDINLDQEPVINTLGRTYRGTDDESNISLFADGDDDEIFKNKKSTAKASLFDSDSDSELFGARKNPAMKKVDKVLEVKKVEKVVEVKKSLFGDDDDEDDLFGVKIKKSIDSQPKSTKSIQDVKETPKPTQTVFKDPLSMFGDDD